MKTMKVGDIISQLKKDGWELFSQKGSHRQFKHKIKKGKVTVNGKLSSDIEQEILHSIFKQASWK